MTLIETYTYKPPNMEIIYYNSTDPEQTDSTILHTATATFNEFCQTEYSCTLQLEHFNHQAQDISQVVIQTDPETWFGALGNTLQHQILVQYIAYSDNSTSTLNNTPKF